MRMNAWWLSAIFAIGMVISILGLVFARRHNMNAMMLLCAWACVTFFLGISIIVMRKVVRFEHARQMKRRRLTVKPINTDIPYIARYSLQIRCACILGAILSGAMIFAVDESYYFPHFLRVLMGFGLCGFCLWATVTAMFTQIQFTAERINARIPWRKEISEPYSNITEFRLGLASLIIMFSTGNRLKITSDLGDSDTIVEFLQRYCPDSAINS
jgi:hypothetical protein